MSRGRHSHRGHCQACGRIQAVMPDYERIAAHGYTTAHGYFAGTCQGAGFSPLQVSRRKCDEFRAALFDLFERQTEWANQLRSLAAHPEKCPKLDPFEQRVYERAGGWGSKSVAVLVPWADASAVEQQRGRLDAIADAERDARWAASSRDALTELAARIHRTELIPVKPRPRPEPTANAPAVHS